MAYIKVYTQRFCQCTRLIVQWCIIYVDVTFTVKSDPAGSGGDSSVDEDSDDEDDRINAEENHDEVNI